MNNWNGRSAPTHDPAIEVENLWRVYESKAQEVVALRGVNMRIGQGQFVALKGRSGSGKTVRKHGLLPGSVRGTEVCHGVHSRAPVG